MYFNMYIYSHLHALYFFKYFLYFYMTYKLINKISSSIINRL